MPRPPASLKFRVMPAAASQARLPDGSALMGMGVATFGTTRTAAGGGASARGDPLTTSIPSMTTPPTVLMSEPPLRQLGVGVRRAVRVHGEAEARIRDVGNDRVR